MKGCSKKFEGKEDERSYLHFHSSFEGMVFFLFQAQDTQEKSKSKKRNYRFEEKKL
jgi:hypothetical protein